MKKKLEAELISIAHRILKLKNKSELDQLHTETQRLYEKLSVLKFVEENFANAKPTIGQSEANGVLETAFDAQPSEEVVAEQTAPSEFAAYKAPEERPSESDDKPEDQPEETEEVKIQEPEQPETEKTSESESQPALETPLEKEVDEVIAEVENDLAGDDNQVEEEKAMVPENEENIAAQGISFEEPETKEEVAAATADPAEVKQEDLFKPSFEWAFDAKAEEKTEVREEPKTPVAFEDFLGKGYVDPVFVKPEELKPEQVSYTPSQPAIQDAIPISRAADKVPVFKMSSETPDKSISLNDRLSKGITVGLNDRIAFVKNLFNNSNEDYNRVLSQLITFDTLEEAQDFIDNMVKPDYGNWEGKDEYAQRFMEVVEKKFT